MTDPILAAHEAREAARRQRNQALLESRVALFNARPGPRVGDFIRLPDLHPKLGQWTRLTHDWGDLLQTGGTQHGSYYLGDGWLSYSGGLDHGVPPGDLRPSTETREGRVWLFDRNQACAGGGVDFMIPCRVFTLREGADLSGLDELRCPYHLQVLNEEDMRRPHWSGYRYLITKHAMSSTAFRDEASLLAWLSASALETTQPWQNGVRSCQFLRYTGTKTP